jgi:hypothetical protein
MHQAKPFTNNAGPPKNMLNVLRRCISRHIKVFWAQAKHKVTYGTPHDKGLVTCLLQAFHRANSPRGHQSAIDANARGLMNLGVVTSCMATTMGMTRRKPGKGAKEFSNHEAKSIKPLGI